MKVKKFKDKYKNEPIKKDRLKSIRNEKIAVEIYGKDISKIITKREFQNNWNFINSIIFNIISYVFNK